MVVKKRKAFKPSEKFLTSQFSFFTIPGFGWAKKILRGVPALKDKHIRRFFFGQLISNIGSWMQVVALGWLVFQITNSAFWVGVVAASASIPALVFSLFGGWIVDRFPKKSVLLLTHILAMVFAFILGTLTQFNRIDITLIIIFSLLGGIINSIYTPAHFSYIAEIVDKENISSAMSINASVSSLGRILGPIFAGLYITIGGIGGAFIINGLTYVAVILALLLIKKPSRVINQNLDPLLAIKEGLAYVFRNPMIRGIILYVGSASIFAWSYATILPVVAKNVLHTDAAGMSYLYTSTGLGAIVATFLSAIFAHRISKLTLFFLSNTLFAISLLLFTYTTNLALGLLYIFLVGLGLTVINIVLGTIVQHLTDPSYRGRVTSIYFVVYGGVLFLGNLEIGYLTDLLGPQVSLRVNTVIMLLIGLYILLVSKRLRTNQSEYNNSLIHH